MAYPKESDVEIPLLLEIDKAGGQARPQDVYAKVAQHFAQLTTEDLERCLESSPSTYKWHNHVQWARQKLVEKGEIDGSVQGYGR
jgi:restriction system protein